MSLSPTKRALLEKWLTGQPDLGGTGIPKRPMDSAAPLSFPQQRQLFLELLERGTAVNNLSVLLQLDGKTDYGALEKSANQIMARHEVLRTRFSFGMGMPTPEVLTELKVSILIVDLKQFKDTDKMTEARQLAEKEVLQPFDLGHAPLIRLKLYSLGNEKNLLLVVVHHTIADGWSFGVFLRELMMVYQHLTVNKPLQLPELPIQYADFAFWQTDEKRGNSFHSSLAYWKKQLSGELPVLELPTDHQRGARQSFRGATHRFVVSRELTEACEKFCRQEDVTLFMTMLSVFNILLHRYSGQEDIVVGTPIANRNMSELEPLIGVFINTLALRTDLSGDPGFSELLGRVRDVSLGAYAHQDLPFEKLVEELKPKRDLSRTPVFQVVFNLQNSPMPKLGIPGLSIKSIDIDRGVSQFDLTLLMSKLDGQCHATVEYNSDLFTPATISRMFRSFQMLLEEAITKPCFRISRLPLVPKGELDQLVSGLNRTQLEFPRDRCFHQLFEEQVERAPDAVAVVYNHRSITYLQLNRRANALARHLRLLGVGKGIRVGIFMERSLEIVEALLAVHKAGGVYVPVHTSFPPDRVQYMLKDADVRVLVTNVDPPPLGENGLHVVQLAEGENFQDVVSSDLQTSITQRDLAYIMYTSGSTGQPKGVMVEHAALVNLLWSIRDQPGINREDVLLSVTPISFDIAALELFLPLLVGAKVVIAGREMIANPIMMVDAVDQYEVTMMQATPVSWQIMIESGWKGTPGLKALCGGDVLTRKLADQLLDRVECLWNMYGPTETTIWSSGSRVEKGDAAITIGQPIGNTQLYILDSYLQLLPVGVVGELHIGGDGLARGYLDQPGLTGEKFINDPFVSRPGARLYKTGDRARYLEDGSIEVRGRVDDQVKIHGHRIELGEIASVLMQHPSVQDAVVIVRAETQCARRIVAYYVLSKERRLDTSEVQDFMRKKLPVYMMPAVFICLDNLPVTQNGKIDRKALPVPNDVRPLDGYVSPRNEDEKILAGIWQSVLGIEQVGIHDNFFDLGGASIQSLQIVAHANMAGFRLSAETIFEYQTLAELSEQITLGKKGGR